MTWEPGARIVVAADDHAYMAFQAVTACYSYRTKLDHSPLVVVHDRGAKREHPYWRRLEGLGGSVLRAPNYRGAHQYLPRNTAGSLLEAARALRGTCDRIVLVDADMVAVGRPKLPDGLAGEHYGHMFWDKGDGVRLDAKIAKGVAAGIDRSVIELYLPELSIGVPYVVPMSIAEDLAAEWIRIMDVIHPPGTPTSAETWDDQMYAFSFAAIQFGAPSVTRLVQFDGDGSDRRKLDPARPLIHYAYGSRVWKKHSWFSPSVGVEGVWSTPILPIETVQGEYLKQIREAGAWFNGAPLQAA